MFLFRRFDTTQGFRRDQLQQPNRQSRLHPNLSTPHPDLPDSISAATAVDDLDH